MLLVMFPTKLFYCSTLNYGICLYILKINLDLLLFFRNFFRRSSTISKASNNSASQISLDNKG